MGTVGSYEGRRELGVGGALASRASHAASRPTGADRLIDGVRRAGMATGTLDVSALG